MRRFFHFHKAALFMRTVAIFLLIAVYMFALTPLVSADFSDEQRQSFQSGVNYFNTAEDCSASGNAATGQVNQGTETPKWVTSLQPPYSLEDFAVEVLRDLALKEKVPESSTVTQEHVLFFVAYTQREGGNITNTSLYNPWNTGYSGPDLKPVNHDTGGAQAYASFNDGVEAYARVLSGTGGSSGYQSRIGTIFSKPDSSADDVARTLVYYKQYPGNLAWAAASEEPHAASYLQSITNIIQTTRSHYTSIASLLIGPPGNSARKNLHSPHPLRYKFSGDTSTSKGNVSTSSATPADCATPGASAGVVSQNLVQTAINLAWGGGGKTECPNNNCKHGLQAKQAYLDALAKYDGGGAFGGADCGSFVATVIRASGADPNFPPTSTNVQQPYMDKHPEMYQKITNLNNTSNLQPGDIFIIGNAGAAGHTFLYIGPQPTGKNAAGASMKEQMPYEHNIYFSNDYGQFSIYRMTK